MPVEIQVSVSNDVKEYTQEEFRLLSRFARMLMIKNMVLLSEQQALVDRAFVKAVDNCIDAHLSFEIAEIQRQFNDKIKTN